MFINPKYAIEQNWIQGVQNPDKQVQPNAIDFTLDTVHQLDSQSACFISDAYGKNMRQTRELSPFVDPHGGPNRWILSPGCYDGLSNIYVDVPEGVAAFLITRSTFNRNGLFIQSGLYDSGFQGHIGFVMYNIGGPISIATNTRIGQIVFVKSESAGVYAGGWNHERGTDWKEKQ